jgi:hypothetical protein
MKVFQVGFDVDHFQSLATQKEAIWLDIPFECAELLPNWKPPAMYVRNPAKPAPDLWFVGIESAIAATGSAFDHVQTQFEMAGECLPLPTQEQEFTLLNVTQCVNCLDHDRSQFLKAPDGRKLLPLKFAFHKNRFEESSIFKIPEMRGIILCLERDEDPDLELKAAVDEHRLKGLRFQQLWSSD